MEVEFRELLNRLMESRRLSQSDIARAALVDRSRVSQWRRGLGFPSPQTLERLSDEFGLDLELLQRVCGYRRQVTSKADPEELEFVAILRQVPTEKRSAARDMLLGLAVQPTNKGPNPRGLVNGRKADSDTGRPGRGRTLKPHTSSGDDSAEQGRVPTYHRSLKTQLLNAIAAFGRLLQPSNPWAAEPAR